VTSCATNVLALLGVPWPGWPVFSITLGFILFVVVGAWLFGDEFTTEERWKAARKERDEAASKEGDRDS
jgi:hypothetical protein